jgi:PPOX class probable F420-dependent enzyme
MAGKSPLMSDQTRAKLKAARVARLATIDANRMPHMVPICFSYDGSLFYTAIDRKPKNVPPGQLARLKNIQMNRQVALLIDEYDEDWTRLWYVLVRGEAELVSSLAERAHALAQLQAKYPQYRSGMLADDGPILRITPLRISTWGKLTNTAAEPER